ncbi:Ig-like domain-containing protein, partial [Pantoea dispersa]|uniref:Ig-like domain-containing protein n=1 Tax=Pantoea dispersa TaxID=59814 RepID=UPI002DBDCC79
GTTLIGSTVVGADGSWSIPADLSGDGEHALSASFTDAAGNESAKSTPVVVDLDTTAPDAPAIGGLSDGKGTNLTTGGLTNNGSLTLTGSGGIAGDVVKIYDGANVVGSAVVHTDGTWSVSTSIMGDGDHNLSASFTDTAGNESVKSAAVVIVLDTTTPNAPVISEVHDGKSTPTDLMSNGLTNNANITVAGSGGTAGELVKLYNGANGNLIGSAVVAADGSWSVSVRFSNDGQRDLQATFTDAAGNESTHSIGVPINLDTTVANPAAPTITDSSGNVLAYNADTNELKPLVSGTAEPYASIVLRIALSASQGWGTGNRVYTTTADENGKWSIQVPDNLPDGDMFFRVRQTDLAGNVSDLGVQGRIHILTGSNASASTAAIAQVDDNVADYDHSSLLNIDDAQHHLNGDAQDRDEPTVVPGAEESAALLVTATAEGEQAKTAQETAAIPNVTEEQPISFAHLAELQHETNTVSVADNGTHNNINITVEDVLTCGEENLFIEDGHKQLMVQGDEHDSVNLQAIIGDKGVEQWNVQGEVTIEGTVYNFYQTESHDVDVLIQQGMQVHQQ